MDRRTFLTFLGTGAAALAAASTGLGVLEGKAEAAEKGIFGFHVDKNAKFKFEPIAPSSADELLLPKGFKYDVVAAYGDIINNQGDVFGFNCDFTIYFPIEGSNTRGLLWVNHEYSSDLFVHGAKSGDKYSAEQIRKMLYTQGGSIIEVYRDAAGLWKMDTSSKYARRVSGLTPFALTGPAKGSLAVGGATTVQGTFANCSGGTTLWNTVLSCEENYEATSTDAGLNMTHYGWVVEVDPFDPSFPVRKHTALGRFHHENSAMGISKDGRIVVYMGDDKTDACIYKYISDGKYVQSSGRSNTSLLENGQLYAADLRNGKWILLSHGAVNTALMNEKYVIPSAIKSTRADLLKKYTSQADVLVHVAEVAILLGATPTDRPEDLEISPFDNTIFVAHTNNDVHGNIHGHITRLFEKDNDLGATEFDFEIFAAGGRQSGFSAPDNITFDTAGNLWTVTDISSSKLGKGVYASFKNNGVFVIPTSGNQQGKALQFASAPVEAEMTGPWFTPDESTLFMAVQHPGEETKSLSDLTSRWPHRLGDHMPRPAVVAITGFKK
ncbi:hypothetical protein SY83_20790 [Paenibacillus swuensis]|uniref:Phosphatase n=2 Tax=Paenibacillus swuensis TaxID=1178515 RepID=A0A172TQ97_9BACL|nr:hypothetical protein SY83_20790 [Paenibacillus swuensis]